MGERSVTAPLRGGRAVEIRAITADDREVIRTAFDRLSAESVYRRFFGPMPELSERDITYLTQIDHHDHEALIAFDRQSGEGVGVARYVRTGPEVAEPAIVVIDDWQGHGVGSTLLSALAERAREEGIARFEAPVLATNNDAIRVLERLGETTKHRAGREVELTIDLPDLAADNRWRRLLRAFATGALEPGRTVLGRLWPRRPGAPGDPRRNVIVVGTDGSAAADRAVEAASSLALASGARVELVGVHPFLATDTEGIATTVAETAGHLRRRGVDTAEHVRRGDPALVLTDLADRLSARLIVVGASRRTKAARRLVGSVSDAVAERSPCDVLIVRTSRTKAPADD